MILHPTLASMFSMGPGEIIMVLAIFLLLFGAKKLPDLARSLGESINEFKKGRDQKKNEDSLRKNEDSQETLKD